MAKRKKLVEVTVKIYEHQLELLEDSAKRIGKAIAKRNASPAYFRVGQTLRRILDEYYFFVRPNLRDFIKSKKSIEK